MNVTEYSRLVRRGTLSLSKHGPVPRRRHTQERAKWRHATSYTCGRTNESLYQYCIFFHLRRLSAGVASKRDHPDSVCAGSFVPPCQRSRYPKINIKRLRQCAVPKTKKNGTKDIFDQCNWIKLRHVEYSTLFTFPEWRQKNKQRQQDTGHWTPAFLFFLGKTPRTHTPSFFHGVPRGSIWQSSLFICK